MIKNCSTCIHKEGSCYPSLTIFDKDKICGSYESDYEGYIAELEQKNTELKLKLESLEGQTPWKDIKDKSEVIGKLTKAKEIIKELARVAYADFTDGDYSNELSKVLEQAEQFLEK